MTVVKDAPGMLRVKMTDQQTSFATVLVVAEHAERAAFARTALAVKLRELDAVCTEQDRLSAIANNLIKEVRTLAIHCERYDADLEAAINGRLRKAE